MVWKRKGIDFGLNLWSKNSESDVETHLELEGSDLSESIRVDLNVSNLQLGDVSLKTNVITTRNDNNSAFEGEVLHREVDSKFSSDGGVCGFNPEFKVNIKTFL